tara:strand:+ start:3936 stop:4565 length:630 start_codon:yes stop_codon:yes gene_type:complete
MIEETRTKSSDSVESNIKFNSGHKFFKSEDFLEFIIKNKCLNSSIKFLNLFLENKEKLTEYNGNKINIKRLDTDHLRENLKNIEISNEFLIKKVNKLSWDSNYFDYGIVTIPYTDSIFEFSQEILIETSRILKKDQHILLNILFYRDNYFNNNFNNIIKRKQVTLQEFAFKFQYCQVQRLCNPFLKIINYSYNYIGNEKTPWKILVKNI